MPALFALDSGWQGSGELGQDIPGFLLLPADDLLSLNLPWGSQGRSEGDGSQLSDLLYNHM